MTCSSTPVRRVGAVNGDCTGHAGRLAKSGRTPLLGGIDTGAEHSNVSGKGMQHEHVADRSLAEGALGAPIVRRLSRPERPAQPIRIPVAERPRAVHAPAPGVPDRPVSGCCGMRLGVPATDQIGRRPRALPWYGRPARCARRSCPPAPDHLLGMLRPAHTCSAPRGHVWSVIAPSHHDPSTLAPFGIRSQLSFPVSQMILAEAWRTEG